MNKTKHKPYTVPVSVQRIFTYTIGGFFLVQTLFIAYSTYQQFQQGSDYRPQLGYFLVSNLVPVIVFAMAYALNRRELTVLARAFEALLISIAAFVGWSLLAWFLPMLLLGKVDVVQLEVYEYLSAAVFLGAYTGLLLWLRAKRLW